MMRIPTALDHAVVAVRTAGVLDGMWTLPASLGSKFQILVLLAVATRIGEVAGAGRTILGVSTAYLLVAVLDGGLTPQTTKSYAAGALVSRRTVLGPLIRRLVLLLVLAPVVGGLVLQDRTGRESVIAWALAITCLTLSLQASQVMTQLAFGLGRFRAGATLNGAVRSATIPLLFGCQSASSPLWMLLLVLASAESLIALLQFRALRSLTSNEAENGTILTTRQTWRLGIGSIANTAMNKSDTVVVSMFASATALGTYGLASQLENALTTAALVPAGAVLTYAARAESRAIARKQGAIVVGAVSSLYVLMAIPFLLFPAALVELLFSVSVEETLPFRICVVAGLFSCLAGIAMQQLVAFNRQSLVATVWLCVAAVAVGSLAVGTALHGAGGAATAALVRDVLFFGMTWISVRRSVGER